MAVIEATTQRHPQVEAWLGERGVPFDFTDTLAVADIDAVASLANQARLEPLDEDVVDRYTADMERGDMFPPIVVNRVVSRTGSRLIILGGNHRAAAARRAKRSHLAAYVVQVEPEMALRITYEDNRRHGLAPSEEERLFQASHLIAGGYTHRDAAEVVGLSEGKVQRFVSVQATDQRAKDLHIRGWDKLPRTTKWRLGNIRSNPVFEKASELAIAGVLTGSAVFDVVAKLNAARSEEDAFVILGMEEDRGRAKAQSKAGGLIKRATPRSKLLGSISSLAVLEAVDVAASCASADQRQELSDRVAAAIKHLQAIKKALA